MKERGIIFNSEMVRAILDGRKTQTRRVVKHQRHPSQEIKLCDDGFFHWSMIGAEKPLSAINYEYGRVGDRLWVRETWQGPLINYTDDQPLFKGHHIFEKSDNCVYKADGGETPEFFDCDDNLKRGWKPSIHMPRWASRITLEITNVRVERLNDISARDVVAEGLIQLPVSGRYVRFEGAQHFGLAYRDHKEAFADLWGEVSKPDCNFESNPWVWVIEFKRV
ncbi:hypothetical protein AHYW_002661 [Providencia manganoxydans]|uniref:hypothetical protein n=1 Tax=Providencia manganoxydans TaxID=2923283 RepID=UPI003D9FF475